MSPKTDAYDQVYALGDVLWHIDTAIDLSIGDLKSGVETLKALSFPVEPGDTEFSSNLSIAAESVSTAMGRFAGYISKAKSSKVSGIGAELKPGSGMTATLANFAQGVSSVEDLDPLADWKNITSSDAVKTVLERDDESSENMQNMINDVEGNNISNIDRIEELKALIDEANTIAVQAEQVVDVAAEETGEKPESSDLLDHYERSIRAIVREVLLP